MPHNSDYFISEVCFNAKHTHIDKVRVHKNNNNTVEEGLIYDRNSIIDAIKKNITFQTIVRYNGTWNLGQPVFIILINGVEFIKTTNNGEGVDNLDNLPEF